ncbi:hypothetical protein [Streptomyces sp. XD-27]|uniref:hypothetical protein n=1 Tax=Streptomyces sp. XD-27 TaxID=3062779 RepID=UPI0026F4765C|nr:hypothetical protein [Streptomyces sp. XD-27]WKX71607.1 hypothetical protein Q3Y56_18290 [Streptomyces sp. XD-27]
MLCDTFDWLHPAALDEVPDGEAPDGEFSDGAEVAANADVAPAATKSAALTAIALRTPRLLCIVFTFCPS